MNCLDLALALAGDPVPIADQVTWDLIPGERLSNLLRDPHGMPLIPDSAVFLLSSARKSGITAVVGMLILHLIYGVVLGTTYGLLGVVAPVRVL